MNPTSRELSFVVRFKEAASQAISRVNENLNRMAGRLGNTDRAMKAAALGMDRLAKSGRLFSTSGTSVNIATRQMTTEFDKVVGASNRVAAAFKKQAAATKKVEDATKKTSPLLDKFNSATVQLTKSTQVAFGPLSGVASRLTALNAILQNGGFRLAAFATAIIGAGGLVVAAARAAAEIDKLVKQTQRLGINFEVFQQFSFAASQSGVRAEQFGRAMETLQKRIAESAQGFGEARRSLVALGLDFRRLANASPEEIILTLAERFSTLDNEIEKTQIAANLFSRANLNMANFLDQGREGLEKLMASAKEYGIVLSEEVGRKSVEATDALDLLGRIIDINLKRSLVTLLPAITAAANILAQIGPVLATLTPQIVGLTAAFVTFGLSVWFVGPGIAALIAGIVGLGTAAALSGDNLKNAMEGIANNIKASADRGVSEIDRLLNKFDALRDTDKVGSLQSIERLKTTTIRELARLRKETSGEGDKIIRGIINEVRRFNNFNGVAEFGKKFGDRIRDVIKKEFGGEKAALFLGPIDRATLKAVKSFGKAGEGLASFAGAFNVADQRGLQFLQTMEKIEVKLAGMRSFAQGLPAGLGFEATTKSALEFNQALAAQQQLLSAGFFPNELPSMQRTIDALSGSFASWGDDIEEAGEEISELTKKNSRLFIILNAIGELNRATLKVQASQQVAQLGSQITLLNKRLSLVGALGRESAIEIAGTQKQLELEGKFPGIADKLLAKGIARAKIIAAQTFDLQVQLATLKALQKSATSVEEATSKVDVFSNFSGAEARAEINRVNDAIKVRNELLSAKQIEPNKLPGLDVIREAINGNVDALQPFIRDLEKVKQIIDNTGVASDSARIFDILKQNDALGEQLKLLDVRKKTLFSTNVDRKIALDLEKLQNTLIALEIPLNDKIAQQMRERIVLLGKQTDMIDKQQTAIDDLANTSRRGLQDIGKGFTDVLLDAEKGWKDMEEVAAGVFRRITDKVLELAIINPVINSLLGGSVGGTTLPTISGGGGNILDSVFRGIQTVGSVFGALKAPGFDASAIGGSANAGGGLMGGLISAGIGSGPANAELDIGIRAAQGTILKADRGRILRRPTLFPGKLGGPDVLAREAGRDEGVLPLTRMRSGDLGVSVQNDMPQSSQPPVNVIVNQRIVANDPNTFRASVGQIGSQTRRAMERHLSRNG